MTLDKVKEIIASQLNIDAKKIKAEDKIIDDLGADSLDIVELLMKLEEEFGISIPDEETSKMQTVGEILDVVKSKKTE